MSSAEAATIKERGPVARVAAAVGGVLAALGASACCILPLAFAFLGISGAWIGNLTALEPFKPYFLGFGTAFVLFGFWRVYGRREPSCAEGTACARPLPGRLVRAALWLAATLLLLSATASYWAPLFY
ncbi:MAG: mercuric transporter MerT family protein [Rhodothalassiaceae bacterium]